LDETGNIEYYHLYLIYLSFRNDDVILKNKKCYDFENDIFIHEIKKMQIE